MTGDDLFQERLFNGLVYSEVWTMIRPAAFAIDTLRAAALLAGVLFIGLADRAAAQGLTYVEADDFVSPNLTPSAGGPLSDALDSNMAVGTDNKWGFRALGAGSTVYESAVGLEDSPELIQTISGLTPGSSYDVYVAYWTDGDENWAIRAGLAPGVNTLYSWQGAFGATPVAGSTPGITAAAVGSWNVFPPPTPTGAMFTDGPTTDVFDRVLLLAKAGTTNANGSGEIAVYIDDNANGGGGRRSWLDGVAYRPSSAAPISLTATLDANTGALTLTNPTSTPFQIKSYTVTSASGSLNGTTWTPIAGNRDGAGNGSFDSDIWQVTAPVDPAATPWTTQLAEAETPANNGGTLAAGGGTISFGNVYRKNRFQDLQLNLTLADDSVISMIPTYNGAPIDPSDFNADGSITLADFQILMTNMHTDISTFTQGQAHTSGDATGDRAVNFADFTTFRTAYDLANGAGAFAQMASQIPEPASLGMLAIAGAFAAKFARRRRLAAAAAVAMCCLVASSAQAQTLLKVDVDARAGDSTAGPPGDNTVSGFGSFTLTPATTGAQPSSTGVVNGYTISVLAVNAAGDPQPGIDDRDRATPTTAPTLNQLYDDFIFTAAGVGAGGGIDLTVSGGTLMPNTPYSFSLYAFDTGSTGVGRTADWLDGNRNNIRSFSTSFAGGTSPTTDEQYRFTGVAMTDGSGQLFVRGRNTTPLSGTTINPGVFVNGFEVNPFTGLTLEVNSTTGAVRLLNEQSAPIELSYYEIRSATGALNPAGWSSLDDAEGGDPLGTGWDEAGGSSANVLSEGNLTGSLTLAASGGSASLGSSFSVGGMQDLSFSYAAPGAATLQGGFVKFVTGGAGDADFDNDSDVDGNDFLIWQRGVGVGNSNATGDANNSGTVDGADLAVWRSEFGPASVAAVGAVPEPGSAALLVLAGFGGVMAGRLSTIRRR
jgi:hypothetical protein